MNKQEVLKKIEIAIARFPLGTEHVVVVEALGVSLADLRAALLDEPECSCKERS